MSKRLSGYIAAINAGMMVASVLMSQTDWLIMHGFFFIAATLFFLFGKEE